MSEEIRQIKKESAKRILEHVIKKAYDDGYTEGRYGEPRRINGSENLSNWVEEIINNVIE